MTLQKKKKIGIIGLDSMHAVALTKSINLGQLAESECFEVIAAYPKGSKNLPYRIEKVPLYTQQIKELGVEVILSIDSLLEKVDFVILTSNDGHVHLEQALMVMRAGKPIFIDKPLAGTWHDSLAIVEAAEKYAIPIFSSSSLRFIETIANIDDYDLGDILGVHTFSPAQLEPNLPELLWYGIHGIEMLFAILGEDCRYVQRTFTSDFDLVLGEWDNGKIGTFRGFRKGVSGFGGVVHGSKENMELGRFSGYDNLASAILRFFKTGDPPVTLKETLKIIAFTIAADESKLRNGSKVNLPKI